MKTRDRCQSMAVSLNRTLVERIDDYATRGFRGNFSAAARDLILRGFATIDATTAPDVLSAVVSVSKETNDA